VCWLFIASTVLMIWSNGPLKRTVRAMAWRRGLCTVVGAPGNSGQVLQAVNAVHSATSIYSACYVSPAAGWYRQWVKFGASAQLTVVADITT
jgi:hypothetical protein